MDNQNKIRIPHCSKCRNHGLLSPLKGHKRRCTVAKCTCAKCALVDARRDISKRQIALRRLQIEEEEYGIPEGESNKNMHSHGHPSPPSSTSIYVPQGPGIPNPGTHYNCYPSWGWCSPSPVPVQQPAFCAANQYPIEMKPWPQQHQPTPTSTQ